MMCNFGEKKCYLTRKIFYIRYIITFCIVIAIISNLIYYICLEYALKFCARYRVIRNSRNIRVNYLY